MISPLFPRIVQVCFICILVLPFTVYSQKEVKAERLVIRNGIIFEVNSSTAFSGKGVDFHDNEQKSEEITYVNGKRNGALTKWYENGQKSSEIMYKDGLANGKATSWYVNGQIRFIGKNSNGIPDGNLKQFFMSGILKIDETHINGKRNGKYTENWENGTLKIECSYINNILNGNYTEGYQNGVKKIICQYKEGQLEGSYLEFWDNETKMIVCQYKKGVKVGNYYEYWNNSQLKEEIVFTNNDNNKTQKTYFGNGQLESEYFWFNGLKEGVWREWFENGNPHSIVPYKNDMKNGFCIWYLNVPTNAEDERTRERCNFINDQPDGKYEWWSTKKWYIDISPNDTRIKEYNRSGFPASWYIEGHFINGAIHGIAKYWEIEFMSAKPLNQYYSIRWENGIALTESFTQVKLNSSNSNNITTTIKSDEGIENASILKSRFTGTATNNFLSKETNLTLNKKTETLNVLFLFTYKDGANDNLKPDLKANIIQQFKSWVEGSIKGANVDLGNVKEDSLFKIELSFTARLLGTRELDAFITTRVHITHNGKTLKDESFERSKSLMVGNEPNAVLESAIANSEKKISKILSDYIKLE